MTSWESSLTSGCRGNLACSLHICMNPGRDRGHCVSRRCSLASTRGRRLTDSRSDGCGVGTVRTTVHITAISCWLVTSQSSRLLRMRSCVYRNMLLGQQLWKHFKMCHDKRFLKYRPDVLYSHKKHHISVQIHSPKSAGGWSDRRANGDVNSPQS